MGAAIITSSDTTNTILEKTIPETEGFFTRLHLEISRLWRSQEVHVQNHVRKSLAPNAYHSIVIKNYFKDRVIYVTHHIFIREIAKQTGNLLQIKFLEEIANIPGLRFQAFANNLRRSQHGKFLNPLTDLAIESIKNHHFHTLDHATPNALHFVKKYVILAILENFIGYSSSAQHEAKRNSLLKLIEDLYQNYKKSSNAEEFKKNNLEKLEQILLHLLQSQCLIKELIDQFSKEQITDFLLNLFSVCADILINWLLSSLKCLAEYKDIWKHDLAEEACSKEHTITQNLKSYHHLDAFLKEVWRLHTPLVKNEIITDKPIEFIVPLSVHSSTHKTVEVSEKYFIPKNSKIVLLYSLSHMEEEYWSNPTEFNPCRFIENEKLKDQLHFFTRGSNGANLAELIVKIYIIEFVKYTENLNIIPPDKNSDEGLYLKFDLKPHSFPYDRTFFNPSRFSKKKIKT